LYLGGIDKLLPMIQESFPELGLMREDYIEMSWIESIIYFAAFRSGESLEVLLNRTPFIRYHFKGKSDYVQEPIPELGLEGIWQRCSEKEGETGPIVMTPYGGRMNEISESATPFPHRAGNIYKVCYAVFWEEGEEGLQWERTRGGRRWLLRESKTTLFYVEVFFNFIFYSNKGILVTLKPKTMSFWVFHPFLQFHPTEEAIL
jgi:hypothetical protein